MKIRLFYKLFAVFFVTSLLVVAMMILTLRIYVYGTFTEYVDQVELDAQQDLVEGLQNEYEKYKGWERVRENPDLWFQLIRQMMINRMPPARERMDRPPRSFNKSEPRPRGLGRQRGRMMRDHFRGIGNRFSLFDAQKQRVIGPPGRIDRYLLKPIESESLTVGWLGLRKSVSLTNPLEVSFLRQQTRMMYLVGGGSFLVALLVAFLVSRSLLSPIRRLTDGTQSITDRRFDTRIDVKTSDELGRLASDFNTMAANLEKYEDQRRQWIRDITHELGTPLSILRGEIEAVQDGVRELTLESLNSLHSEVMHLSKIVNDLREISLAETGGLSNQLEILNPLEVAHDSLTLYQGRLADRQIELQVDFGANKDFRISADRDRLKQVVSNISENALRYADSPGIFRSGYEVEGQNLLIYFEDSGPGVPEASLPHLFDKLYRVDESRSRSKGGSGLGLAICKYFVEMVGGEIRAANQSGKGLRIEIRFPLINS